MSRRWIFLIRLSQIDLEWILARSPTSSIINQFHHPIIFWMCCVLFVLIVYSHFQILANLPFDFRQTDGCLWVKNCLISNYIPYSTVLVRNYHLVLFIKHTVKFSPYERAVVPSFLQRPQILLFFVLASSLATSNKHSFTHNYLATSDKQLEPLQNICERKAESFANL